MSVQSEITRLQNAKAAIKAAIEGKGVTVPNDILLDGMAALIESIEAGGGGINATAGTITLSDDANNYVLTHGLGEVPVFFTFGMIDNFSKLTGKTYMLIGGWGLSSVSIQYRLSATSASRSLSGSVREYSISVDGTKTSIDLADEQTIMLADSTGTSKLIGGATYYWVAIGSEVFV